MTPEQQKAYYAKNKAEAVEKEKKADYEAFGSRGDAARKGMEESRMDQMGTAYKKGGKVKKMAEGGEAGGLEEAIRLERMGVTPRMLREQTASNELQDLLPSGKKIGAALRSKLDPETAAEMAMPQMAIARKIADAAKNAKMPKSYADASGMKKGGSVKSSASKRADGCAQRGKTKGKYL
jgi:hypothetical protein